MESQKAHIFGAISELDFIKKMNFTFGMKLLLKFLNTKARQVIDTQPQISSVWRKISSLYEMHEIR